MNLRHNTIEIPKDGSNPFVNCKLEREKYADVLTEIVSDYNSGFVLAINNQWGAGKTTFIKMWRQQLVNNGYSTLYFNAWENDFQEDVIVALLSELEELKNKGENTFKNLVEKSAVFLKKVIPAVVKGAAGKAIGDEGVTEVVGAVTEFTTEEVESQIKKFNEKKNGVEDFRVLLEKFVENVDKEKPVIFMIDELDRCRPKYAVEVLEQIKHLFSVPGIVFVLSIDKIQLGNAVRGFYGSESIEADEYLRRFIDLEYVIPEPNKRLMVNYLYDYFQFNEFFENPERGRQFLNEKTSFKNFTTSITKGPSFNLRKIEKLFSLSRVALKTVGIRNYVFPDLFILLIFLKIEKEDVFKGICEKHYTVQELIDLVESSLVSSASDDNVLFVYAIVRLAVSYHNYYFEDIYPKPPFKVEKNDKGDVIAVNYKSRFSSDDQPRNLLSAYLSLRYTVSSNSFSIRPILDRILLLNALAS